MTFKSSVVFHVVVAAVAAVGGVGVSVFDGVVVFNLECCFERLQGVVDVVGGCSAAELDTEEADAFFFRWRADEGKLRERINIH